MFDKLKEIERIRTEIKLLSGIEISLSKPLLTDFSLLPILYGWFRETNQAKDFPKRPDSVMQRNKFLLIALRFYSPLTLLGEKMMPGLREELTKLLKIQTSSSISNVSANLFFYYQNYRTFRYEVNKIVIELINKLEERNEQNLPELERPDMSEFQGINDYKNKLYAL